MRKVLSFAVLCIAASLSAQRGALARSTAEVPVPIEEKKDSVELETIEVTATRRVKSSATFPAASAPSAATRSKNFPCSR